jgi:hypothetical protein
MKYKGANITMEAQGYKIEFNGSICCQNNLVNAISYVQMVIDYFQQLNERRAAR